MDIFRWIVAEANVMVYLRYIAILSYLSNFSLDPVRIGAPHLLRPLAFPCNHWTLTYWR